jgi:hypothetical protein
MSVTNLDSYYIRFIYAGLLPFVSIATLVWIVPESLSASLIQFFIAYSAIILSFMAGTLFLLHALPAKFISLRNELDPKAIESMHQTNLAALMVLSLLACLGLLTSSLVGAVILALGFWIFDGIEKRTLPPEFKPYLDLRSIIQRTVLVSHLTVIVFLIQQ